MSDTTAVGHVPVAYPTVDDGMHSVSHLGRYALGMEELTLNTAVAHAWVVAGTGLGQVFPPDLIGGTPCPPCPCPDEVKEKLAQLAQMRDSGAIDWRLYARLVLEVLLRLLI